MNSDALITRANLLLSMLDSEIRDDSLDEYCPNMYVIGLPRSGTTLLTQVMFNGLNIACTSNLVARFWSAPLFGFSLAKAVCGRAKAKEFLSQYGKSTDPRSPHEFSYFWHALLKINGDHAAGASYNMSDSEANLLDLKSTLVNINHIVGGPVVYKPLELVLPFLTKLRLLLPQSMFVYLERDPVDVALSLAQGRLDYYGDVERWFSSQPDNYEQIKSLPFDEQIAMQVLSLRRMYREAIATLPEDNLLHVRYEDLCGYPHQVLTSLVDKSRRLGYQGMHIEDADIPSFKVSAPRLHDDRVSSAVKNAILRLGGAS